MLTELDRELITAAVDGVLTDPQEASFRTLVADSAEAAALYQQLQTQARRLREMRRVPAPAGFEAVVASRIRQLPVVVPSTRRVPVSPPAPRWVSYAVAASLFLALSIGSFWLATRPNSEGGSVVKRKAVPGPVLPDSNNFATVTPEIVAPEVIGLPRPARLPGPDQFAVAPATVGPMVATPEGAPVPREVGSADVVAARPLGVKDTLSTIEVRLPFRASVVDLERPLDNARLREELNRELAFRLDLFVHDPLRAAEVFQGAARPAGLNLVIEASALDRMRKKLPTTWVVYTESLSAEEIAVFLAKLASATRAADPTPVFASAHLFAAQTPEQRDLRDLLGVDPGLWRRSRKPASNSVTAGTVDQVASALQGKEKPAILLTYQPTAMRVPPQLSKEVKAFLDSRGERKPTAVPLMIVIRPIS